MKQRHMLMAAAVALAAWLALFGDKTPSGEIAEPVVRGGADAAPATATPERSVTTAGQDNQQGVILALHEREQLIGGARGGNMGEALFTSQSWTPPPPPPPPPQPAAAPTAPPLPFSYLGKKFEAGKWEVYLAHGEQTFVARENLILEGAYRVDSITASTISLTYLPFKQVQTITFGGTD